MEVNKNYPNPPEETKFSQALDVEISDENLTGDTTFTQEEMMSESTLGENNEAIFDNIESKLSGKSSEIGFIKKVVGIFSAQMVATILIILAFYHFKII